MGDSHIGGGGIVSDFTSRRIIRVLRVDFCLIELPIGQKLIWGLEVRNLSESDLIEVQNLELAAGVLPPAEFLGVAHKLGLRGLQGGGPAECYLARSDNVRSDCRDRRQPWAQEGAIQVAVQGGVGLVHGNSEVVPSTAEQIGGVAIRDVDPDQVNLGDAGLLAEPVGRDAQDDLLVQAEDIVRVEPYFEGGRRWVEAWRHCSIIDRHGH